MKVFHGSYVEIEEIDLSKCQPDRDFGRGFYVTNIREQAEFWAERKGRKDDTAGYVTEFTFYEKAFEHYEVKALRFENYTEEWLDFVVTNRNPSSPSPSHDYDIVEGPVADDKVTRRIFAYMEGHLSKAAFLEELKFFRHTHQIAFCTVKSLQMLKRSVKKSELVMDDIDESIIETLSSELGIKEETVYDLYYTSNTYLRLTDRTTGLWQKPWTEIYQLLLQELNK